MNFVKDSKKPDTLSIEHEGVVYELPSDNYDYALNFTDVNGNILGTVDGYATMWRKTGECIHISHSWNRNDYHDLTPLPIVEEAKWWEDEKNFPAYMISDSNPPRYIIVTDKYWALKNINGGLRLATQEELNSLHVEQKGE